MQPNPKSSGPCWETTSWLGAGLVALHANFSTDQALRLGVFDEQRRLERVVVEMAVDRARERWPDLTVLGRVCAPPADNARVEASRRWRFDELVPMESAQDFTTLQSQKSPSDRCSD